MLLWVCLPARVGTAARGHLGITKVDGRGCCMCACHAHLHTRSHAARMQRREERG